jgi:hypothetical protein
VTDLKNEFESELTKPRQELKNNVEVCVENETPDDTMSAAHLISDSNLQSSVVQFQSEFPDATSDNDDDDSPSDEEEDSENCIIAEYMRINRTRVRFKCDFRNAFILINGKEYVAKLINGDFQY